MIDIRKIRSGDFSIFHLKEQICERNVHIEELLKTSDWYVHDKWISEIKKEIEEINEMINVKIGRC